MHAAILGNDAEVLGREEMESILVRAAYPDKPEGPITLSSGWVSVKHIAETSDGSHPEILDNAEVLAANEATSSELLDLAVDPTNAEVQSVKSLVLVEENVVTRGSSLQLSPTRASFVDPTEGYERMAWWKQTRSALREASRREVPDTHEIMSKVPRQASSGSAVTLLNEEALSKISANLFEVMRCVVEIETGRSGSGANSQGGRRRWWWSRCMCF